MSTQIGILQQKEFHLVDRCSSFKNLKPILNICSYLLTYMRQRYAFHV